MQVIQFNKMSEILNSLNHRHGYCGKHAIIKVISQVSILCKVCEKYL